MKRFKDYLKGRNFSFAGEAASEMLDDIVKKAEEQQKQIDFIMEHTLAIPAKEIYHKSGMPLYLNLTEKYKEMNKPESK